MKLENKDKIDMKKHCPFVGNPPSEDCYIVKMDSQSIIFIMKYCARDYGDCGIYKMFSSEP